MSLPSSGRMSNDLFGNLGLNSCRSRRSNRRKDEPSFNHEGLHHGFQKPVRHPEVRAEPDLVPFLGNGVSGHVPEDQDAVEEERLLAAAEVVDERESGDGVPSAELDIGGDDTSNGEIVL